MSRRAASYLAWSLCALCVALVVASLIFALLNGHTLGEIFTAWGPSIAALATQIVSFSVVGALIASHRPENSIGWIFLTVGFFYGLLSAGDEYAIYALLTNPGALPLGAAASWLGQWVWAPGLGLILVFLPLLFPDGRPPSHRWCPVAWLGGLSIGLAVVSSMILLWPERGPALVTGDESPSHVVDVLLLFAALPMMMLAGLGAVISLLVRFLIRAQYGAPTDGYDLATRIISCAVSAPGTLVRHLAWLILSKEDVRVAFHKIWPVTRDCRIFVGTPDILCTETTCGARPGRCELKFLPDS